MSRHRLLREILLRVEREFSIPVGSVCSHAGPVIRWPDGRVEDNSRGHKCDQPRLEISVSYRGDPHSQALIIEDYQERLADQKAKLVKLPPALMLDWLIEDMTEFGMVILPDTLASLTDLRRAAEAEKRND